MLLFQLTGQDQLGIVADYSDILFKHGAQMLDVEQASCSTHSTFTLNFLVSSPVPPPLPPPPIPSLPFQPLPARMRWLSSTVDTTPP